MIFIKYSFPWLHLDQNNQLPNFQFNQLNTNTLKINQQTQLFFLYLSLMEMVKKPSLIIKMDENKMVNKQRQQHTNN
jgi:hypothetical protein